MTSPVRSISVVLLRVWPSRSSIFFPVAAVAPERISHHIARLIRTKASIDVTFSSGKTLKNLLQANGRGISTAAPNPRGCVYQISCDCGQHYIGETLRPLSTRIKEQVRSDVSLSEHIIKNKDHSIKWEATTVLSSNNNNWRKRKLQEAIDIRRHQPSINRDQGVYLPCAWDSII